MVKLSESRSSPNAMPLQKAAIYLSPHQANVAWEKTARKRPRGLGFGVWV
jgi:hypothetical protein